MSALLVALSAAALLVGVLVLRALRAFVRSTPADARAELAVLRGELAGLREEQAMLRERIRERWRELTDWSPERVYPDPDPEDTTAW